MSQKHLTALLLTGVLAAPAAASRPMNPSIAPDPNAAMPDGLLYCGELRGIETDENGRAVSLRMHSVRSGEYVMNLSEKTAFVDSSAHAALDPGALAVGQRVCVYHSAMVTRSLPPQAAAFAVAANLPMDVSCGRYQEVEAVAETDGRLSVTSENGELTLLLDSETELRAYDGTAAALSDVQTGSFVMVWYEGTGTVHADHLLLLPYEEGLLTDPEPQRDLTAPETSASISACEAL